MRVQLLQLHERLLSETCLRDGPRKDPFVREVLHHFVTVLQITDCDLHQIYRRINLNLRRCNPESIIQSAEDTKDWPQ